MQNHFKLIEIINKQFNKHVNLYDDFRQVSPESGYTTREGSVSSHVAQSLGSEFDTLTLSSQGSFREENKPNHTYETADFDFEPIPEPPRSLKPTDIPVVPPPPPTLSNVSHSGSNESASTALPTNGIQEHVKTQTLPQNPNLSETLPSSTASQPLVERVPPPLPSTVSDTIRYQAESIAGSSDIYDTIDENEMSDIFESIRTNNVPNGRTPIESIPAPPTIDEVFHVPIVPPPPPANDLQTESQSKSKEGHSQSYRPAPDPPSLSGIPTVPQPPSRSSKLDSSIPAPTVAPLPPIPSLSATTEAPSDIPSPPAAPPPPPPPPGVPPEPPVNNEQPLSDLPPPPPMHTTNFSIQMGTPNKALSPRPQSMQETDINNSHSEVVVPSSGPSQFENNATYANLPRSAITKENLLTAPPPPPPPPPGNSLQDDQPPKPSSSKTLPFQDELLRAKNKMQTDQTVLHTAPKQIVLNRKVSESETGPKRPVPPPTMPRLSFTTSNIQTNDSSGIEIPQKRRVSDIVSALGKEKSNEDLPPPPPPLAALQNFEYASLDNVPLPPPVNDTPSPVIPVPPPPPPPCMTLPAMSNAPRRGPLTKPKVAPPTASKYKLSLFRKR